jgi:hypothetical protein
VRRAAALAVAFAAAASTGCEDLSHFSTGKDEAYCGSVVLASEFRQGLSPKVQMSLTLDATELDGPASPGRISTFEASDGVTPERRLLQDVPLRVIAPLEHDALSRLSFGEGRDRNVILAASPNDPKEESLLAILSLKNDDTVEVRLLRAGRPGDGADAPPPGSTPIYGLFPLVRRPGGCGF